MNTDELVKPMLEKIKEAIQTWTPPDSPMGEKEKKATLTDKVRLLSKEIVVSEKTIWNWMNTPGSHPIPLRRVFEICRILGVNPASLFPGTPSIETMHKISEPLEAERVLLEVEENIPEGGVRRVVFPLWGSALILDPLNEIYASKGFYSRGLPMEGAEKQKVFFGERDRKKAYMELRDKRRSLFVTGGYILRLVLMRDELERFVNGDRLFKHCTPQQRIDQINYVLDSLALRTWNQKPRLEMRMTKSYFRMQYGISTSREGSDVLVLNTNSGFLKIADAGALEFLKREFDLMWEEGTYKGIRTTDGWTTFLQMLIAEIQKRIAHPELGKIDIKAMLEERFNIEGTSPV